MPNNAEHAVAELQRLGRLRFDGWRESAVREQFIAPLLRLLGYSIETDYEINHEGQHLLNRRFVMVGRDRIAIDYQLVVRKRSFWIIEAKAPAEVLSEKDVFQAYLYAIHPEVRARYFVVCNGRQTDVYDTRSETNEALLSIQSRDLLRDFPKLMNLLGAQSIIGQLSERLIADLRDLLSAEVLEDRAQKLQHRIGQVFVEAAPRIRENASEAFRAKFSAEETDWKELVEMATTSVQVVTDMLQGAKSLREFNVAHEVLLLRLESESQEERKRTINALLGLPSQAVSSTHRTNLLRALIRLRRHPSLVADHGAIDSAVLSQTKLILAQFAAAPHLGIGRSLEGALFRVFYKAMFCDQDVAKALAAIVEQKMAVITDEERVHSMPSVMYERLVWAHRSALAAWRLASRRPIGEQQQAIAELLREESRIDPQFEKAVEGQRQSLHIYADYDRPFDYMRSMLFHVLRHDFDSVAELVDDEIVETTMRLVAQIGKDYAVNHADDFLVRVLWSRNKVKWECERPSEVFSPSLTEVHVNSVGPPPVGTVRIWGPVGGAYMELLASLDLAVGSITVNSARMID